MVDCGLFQGPKDLRNRNWLPFTGLQEIKSILLTHAHIDHSGFLPRLVREGYDRPVYCSQGTLDLCRIMLLDAAHLQEEDARFANESKHSRHLPALPLYETKDAEQALRLLQPLPFWTWHPLDEGCRFRLIPAGHILGASYIQFEIPQGDKKLRILFSGDIGNDRSCIMPPPEIPPESEVVIMEGTYGNRGQERFDPKEELGQIVKKVLGRGGTLVIPAFSVGRTQELLHLMSQLEQEGAIADVPVYLDSPMAQSATQIYAQHSQDLRAGVKLYSYKKLRMVNSTDESMLLCMSTEPKVVISAAGMLTGGRILHHMKAKLPDEKSAVLFVGYQAEGTKGRLLRQGLKKIRLHHRLIDVEAEILAIDSLSAHADSDELIEWLKSFPAVPRRVILNHGERASLEALRYRVDTELQIPVQIAQDRVPIVFDQNSFQELVP